MKPVYLKQTAASILSGLLIFATAGVGTAESLAGKVGDKRFPISLTGGPKDGCSKGYKDYIAASGHSAFALTSTFAQFEAWYVFCGVQINAPSQKIAEERAMNGCKSLQKRYKVKIVGICRIGASK
jgi:hypothetical protein